MSTQHDVRRLALALPDVAEDVGHFGFSLIVAGKRKGLAWAWRERIDPRKPRVASSTVIAIRVADVGEKQAILASDPEKFFTEPHYDGYPAVLVRLRAIGVRELGRLLTGAWQCQTPKQTKRSDRREQPASKSRR